MTFHYYDDYFYYHNVILLLSACVWHVKSKIKINCQKTLHALNDNMIIASTRKWLKGK